MDKALFLEFIRTNTLSSLSSKKNLTAYKIRHFYLINQSASLLVHLKAAHVYSKNKGTYTYTCTYTIDMKEQCKNLMRHDKSTDDVYRFTVKYTSNSNIKKMMQFLSKCEDKFASNISINVLILK